MKSFLLNVLLALFSISCTYTMEKTEIPEKSSNEISFYRPENYHWDTILKKRVHRSYELFYQYPYESFCEIIMSKEDQAANKTGSPIPVVACLFTESNKPTEQTLLLAHRLSLHSYHNHLERFKILPIQVYAVVGSEAYFIEEGVAHNIRVQDYFVEPGQSELVPSNHYKNQLTLAKELMEFDQELSNIPNKPRYTNLAKVYALLAAKNEYTKTDAEQLLEQINAELKNTEK